jgi:hypothetical protein
MLRIAFRDHPSGICRNLNSLEHKDSFRVLFRAEIGEPFGIVRHTLLLIDLCAATLYTGHMALDRAVITIEMLLTHWTNRGEIGFENASVPPLGNGDLGLQHLHWHQVQV